MKLIEMKRIKGADEEGECDYFVHLESLFEEDLYKHGQKYLSKVPSNNANSEYFTGFGYGMLSGILCMGCHQYLSDDDIYYYFMHDEKVPQVGETFTLDDITWVREV